MLFLIHDHFINPKIELIIIKHLFWLQKEVKNHIRISDMFLWSVTLKLWMVSLLFLTHGHFIRKKIKKRKIQFLVTKRGQKSYQICFVDLRPRNCGWFHLLFSTHNHFIKLKTEKRKIPFLVTKSNQKFNLTDFSDLRLPNCGLFHIILLQNNF